jgi:Tol biopolymer transport system component
MYSTTGSSGTFWSNIVQQRISRRELLAGITTIVAGRTIGRPRAIPFVFTARGSGGFLAGGERPALMNSDGSGFRVLDFHRPNEIGFGIYDFFKDGKALMLSIEKNEEWKTKSFYEYYPRSRTHIWAVNLKSGKLTELANRERIAPFYSPCAIIPGEKRMLVSVNIQGKESLFSMNMDGTEAKRLTNPGEYVYGVSVSHSGKKVAFHADYRICTMDIDGTNRREIAGKEGWIYFGTSWAPDDSFVLFQICNHAADPAHDWSDICIARPDGSEFRRLTDGSSAWFAASYGTRNNPGRGSIMPQWSPDGSGVLYARRQPETVLPWREVPGRVDTDHFNRDFNPDAARGGTSIWCIDPASGKQTQVTNGGDRVFDFRAQWSPDSRQILFLRAAVGAVPGVWIVNRDGGEVKRLSDGTGNGAEFPRWLPSH